MQDKTECRLTDKDIAAINSALSDGFTVELFRLRSGDVKIMRFKRKEVPRN